MSPPLDLKTTFGTTLGKEQQNYEERMHRIRVRNYLVAILAMGTVCLLAVTLSPIASVVVSKIIFLALTGCFLCAIWGCIFIRIPHAHLQKNWVVGNDDFTDFENWNECLDYLVIEINNNEKLFSENRKMLIRSTLEDQLDMPNDLVNLIVDYDPLSFYDKT